MKITATEALAAVAGAVLIATTRDARATRATAGETTAGETAESEAAVFAILADTIEMANRLFPLCGAGSPDDDARSARISFAHAARVNWDAALRALIAMSAPAAPLPSRLPLLPSRRQRRPAATSEVAAAAAAAASETAAAITAALNGGVGGATSLNFAAKLISKTP